MSKIAYAQSSDIKSRTWDEYRDDMKKKAIAELECLPLLKAMLIERYGDDGVCVRKHGSDAVLWFNPRARLSREPDYEASWPDGRTELFELQVSSEPNLSKFDFKLSKVRWKKKGRVGPHTDREFLYLARAERRIGFLTPAWILDHGPVGNVKAWGGSRAYRVPRDKFLPMLQKGDERLDRVIASISNKETLLEFQKGFARHEGLRLANRLRRVVDEGNPFAIVPGTLDAFFETCFLTKKLDRFPDDPGLWLVYLFSLLEAGMSPTRLARAVYAIDYLYFRAVDVSEGDRALRENEEKIMLSGLRSVEEQIGAYPWDGGSVDPRWAPIEELRQMLFVLNRFEDWRQDVFFRWPGGPRPPAVQPAKYIFDMAPDVAAVARRIHEAKTPDDGGR